MTDDPKNQKPADSAAPAVPSSASAGSAVPVSGAAGFPQKKRRRRRKKKLKIASGQDVPLMLSSDKAIAAESKASPDVMIPEEKVPVNIPASVVDTMVPTVTAVAPESSPPLIPVFPPEEAPLSAMSASPTPPSLPTPPRTPPMPPAPPPMSPSEMDQSQKIFEEGVEPKPEPPEPPDEPEPEPEPESEPEPEPEKEEANSKPNEQEEQAKRQASLDEAKKIADSLAQEEPAVLEELPQKQGFLGKIFNVLERLVHGREAKAQQAAAKPVVSQPQVVDAEIVDPHKPGLISRLFKLIVSLAIVGALAWGAFWIGSSLHLLDFVNSWFKPVNNGLELVEGNNAQVVLDPELFNKWGFQSALYFGKNGGDIRNLAYNVFLNASYFGKLRDPVFYGETGITAAIYYGFGKEVVYVKNRFINYVNYLAKIRYANQVSIQSVLKGKTDRSVTLEKYLTEAKAVFDEGNKLRKELNVQVDDLKISVNSINSDKDRFETDFFASLAETEAEKSQTLLVKFVEVTQTQVDLKAKLAALSKLSEYYEADLVLMKIKLDAIEKNKQALITGVTVVETPGVDLNLVRTNQ